MSKPTDELRDASYDGIQEYDNRLPRWWLITFFITIVAGFIYWGAYYVFETRPSQQGEFENAMAAYEEKYKKSEELEVSDESLLALKGDSAAVASGKTVYATNCVACHGQLGEGGIGPNLTDSYWIHGSNPMSMYNVVVNGVVEQGMTPWKGILSDKQIAQVVAYILTLEGTNPPKAKEPQGTKKP